MSLRPWIAYGLLFVAGSTLAGEPNLLSALAYGQKYDLKTGDEADQEAIRQCLGAWGQHPFGPGPYPARFIETSVRVTGVGSETTDDAITDYPQLIFVKPAVSVMTKTTLGLLNPNGWYCIESNVTVMGKLVVRADCHAKIADRRSGATIIGESDTTGGVTVLGATRVESVGSCGQ